MINKISEKELNKRLKQTAGPGTAVILRQIKMIDASIEQFSQSRSEYGLTVETLEECLVNLNKAINKINTVLDGELIEKSSFFSQDPSECEEPLEPNNRPSKINHKIESTFEEPVRMGSCPLCGSSIYSENDPSRDPMARRVCENCDWEDNQFMTWEEIRGV